VRRVFLRWLAIALALGFWVAAAVEAANGSPGVASAIGCLALVAMYLAIT